MNLLDHAPAQWVALAHRMLKMINTPVPAYHGDPGIPPEYTDVLDSNVKIVGSKVDSVNNRHIVALDIDHEALLIPSTTPGHHHLYINVEMDWDKYAYLLRALAYAGVIEEGYRNASMERGYTALRTPWTKKEES